MRDVVLDSSVLLKWLDAGELRHQAAAQALAREFEEGRLRVTAPRFLMLEVLNVVARRWRLDAAEVAAIAQLLDGLRFDLVEPRLTDVARWTAHGLTAYDAAYVAVAEAAGIQLITDDREMLAVAPGIARSLADAT